MLAAGNGIFPLLVFLALWALGGLSTWANKKKQKEEAARREALRRTMTPEAPRVPPTPPRVADAPRVYIPPPTAPALPNRWVAPAQEAPRMYAPPPTAPAAQKQWVAPVQKATRTVSIANQAALPIPQAAAPMRAAELPQRKIKKVLKPFARKPTVVKSADKLSAGATAPTPVYASPPSAIPGEIGAPRPVGAETQRIRLTPATLRRQIVVSEILRQPLALRDNQ